MCYCVAAMHAQRKHLTSVETAQVVARRMPELEHYRRGCPFDIMESPAVDWLSAQPEVRQLVWNLMKPVLLLDVESAKWRGVAWEPSNDVSRH